MGCFLCNLSVLSECLYLGGHCGCRIHKCKLCDPKCADLDVNLEEQTHGLLHTLVSALIINELHSLFYHA